MVVGLSSSHGLAFQADAVSGPVVQSTSIFRVGLRGRDATQPDSVTMGDGSIWVEYGNGADSTGKLPNGGSSTIVQYDPQGRVENTLTLPGSIDGLKYDPTTGNVWALENQDANSSLYLIDAQTGAAGPALSYAPPYVYGADSARGYDDVAFDGNKVFLSHTNPVNVGDPVVQQLDQGNMPTDQMHTTSILRLGDTGINLVTGQTNQPLPVADPDSLKTLSDGSLILTSDHDASLTIISSPGTEQQTASFVTLPFGSSGLDDAIIPTSTSGTFYVSNLGADDVLKVAVTGLNTSDIYESVGSDNAVDQIDPRTGAVTPIITGLNSPHGLMFLPSDGSTAPAAVASLSGALTGLAPALAQGCPVGQRFGVRPCGRSLPGRLRRVHSGVAHASGGRSIDARAGQLDPDCLRFPEPRRRRTGAARELSYALASCSNTVLLDLCAKGDARMTKMFLIAAVLTLGMVDFALAQSGGANGGTSVGQSRETARHKAGTAA